MSIPARIVCFSALLSLAACFFRQSPNSPLAAAASAGNIELVRALLDSGADPNEGSGRGGSALIAAARTGRIEIIQMLVDRGADPNQRGGVNGWTPVMHAIHKHQAEAVESLLARGAEVNAKTRNGLTALIMAAGDGNLEIVRMLLDRGADPHAETREGINALTMAVSGGAFSDIDRPLLGGCQTEIVKALLEKAPDLKLSDDLGAKYAHFFAKFKGCSEVLSLVENQKR